MADHSVYTLGDKKGEHWAIHANVFAVNVEKGELNIYSSKNIAKMEEQLSARAMPRQCDITSEKLNEGKKVPIVHDCSGKENGSSKDTASTTSDFGGISSNGPDDGGSGRQREGSSNPPNFITR